MVPDCPEKKTALTPSPKRERERENQLLEDPYQLGGEEVVEVDTFLGHGTYRSVDMNVHAAVVEGECRRRSIVWQEGGIDLTN